MASVLYLTVNDIDPGLAKKARYPDPLLLIKNFLNTKSISTDELQQTLQAYVISGRNLAAIQLLIDHGANVNYTSYTGGDKLIRIAHQHGNQAIIKLLLENGAYLNPQEADYLKTIDPSFDPSGVPTQPLPTVKNLL